MMHLKFRSLHVIERCINNSSPELITYSYIKCLSTMHVNQSGWCNLSQFAFSDVNLFPVSFDFEGRVAVKMMLANTFRILGIQSALNLLGLSLGV